MQVGDLVKWAPDCDATGWVGIVTKLSGCGTMIWLQWSGKDAPSWKYRTPVDTLEKIQ